MCKPLCLCGRICLYCVCIAFSAVYRAGAALTSGVQASVVLIPVSSACSAWLGHSSPPTGASQALKDDGSGKSTYELIIMALRPALCQGLTFFKQ